MLTKDEAIELVNADLKRRFQVPGDTLVLIDDRTIERPFGWVFFYNSKRYLETRSISHAIAGNGPVIVNKHTSEIKFCGSQKPTDKWISDYESNLKQQRKA